MSRRRAYIRGFSLLELLVALAILGLVLGTLYRAATGATRNVAVAERYSYGILLAQSLLADHGGLALPGYSAAGSSGGYEWRIRSARFADNSGGEGGMPLQRLTAVVRWQGSGNRQVELATIVPVVATEEAP